MPTSPQRRWTLVGLLTTLAACSETTTPPVTTVVDAGADTGPVAADAPAVEDVPAAPEDVPVMPSGIGEPCESEGATFPPVQGDCPRGQVCLSSAIGFRGGYCVSICQGTTCPRDAVCGRLQGFPVCLRTCATNDDCRRTDGYVCRQAEGSRLRACQVNDAPPGLRPDESACFTAGGDRPAPALARVTFTGANGDASGPRIDSFLEAEGNVAIHPTNGHVAVSYISANAGGQIYMGTSRYPGTGTQWFGDGTVRDPTLNSSSDPVLDYALDGVLRMTFIGLQRNASSQVTGVHVRVTESRDDGATWATPRQVDPNGVCPQGTGGICDKPWILSTPGATAGAPAVLYIGYLTQGTRTAELVVQRSDDAGLTWSATIRLAQLGFLGTVAIAHNLVQIAAGSGGLVGAAWAGLSVGDGSGGGGSDSNARFGSPANRVLFRRSPDGFRTLGPLRIVSRLSDTPVYVQPPVALDGADTVHVVYVTGDATGAWDVILATSTNGGDTWQHRRVNDDPSSCALHMLPAMVVDRVTHDVHVTWMENRFGEGAVAYARCPASATAACGRNEQVSDRAFRLSSSRNPMIWHGDYNGLTLSPQGELWATWSDTRTGSPAMYTAHGRARPAE